MAAYAALVSLMNTLDNVHNYPRLSTTFDKKQIKSLGKNLGFFLDFVERCSSYGGISKEELEELESQITSAAHAAEDVIESHIVDRVRGGCLGQYPSSSSDLLPKMKFIIKTKALKIGEKRRLQKMKLHLHKIIEEMDPIKEKVIKVERERVLKDKQLDSSIAEASSSRLVTTGETNLVGFSGYFHQLLDWLTGQRSDRQIIPITGMGGIGKTTLARNAYEDLLTVQHFDVRAWVSISQEYNVTKILSEILSCLKIHTSGKEPEDQLGEMLHKTLAGKRYLIILDDMWSIEVWDKIKFFFSDYHNKSRIIITTRISSVANHFGSMVLALNLLDDDQSWNLFCEKVFGQEVCPPKLEEIGRKIVKKCSGLPLSIVVIGGLLRKSPRTEEQWEFVAKDLSSILNSAEDSQCLNILSLSYIHLPVCLKPCFLYMGVFSEDYEIPISHLIKLWVAEGFLKPNKDQSLEKVAEGYVKDLVDRNLILVRSLKSNGKFKTCNVHDLLRDLCIKVAEKEKFFHVVGELKPRRDRDGELRRIVIQSSISDVVKTTSLARSVIGKRWCSFWSRSRLLRVFYMVDTDLDTVSQQLNLRFLQSTIRPDVALFELSSTISLLWNLQTLFFSSLDVVAPSEIWEMPHLRHVNCYRIRIPNPPRSNERGGTILRHLQTLKKIYDFRFNKEAYKRMPNIKSLFCYIDRSDLSCLYNVGRLNKLESLYYTFVEVPYRDNLVLNLSFPSSLKKLTLANCWLHWNDLTVVGSLPHLEVLNLHPFSFMGPEWNPVEGEFLRLKFLRISQCDNLICWTADNSHFPVLEKLILFKMTRLDELPSGIGEIPTLKKYFCASMWFFCCYFSS